MAVFRVEKNKNFTIMSNYHLQDKSLSLKAKGLLSIMLSLPEDWDYTTKGLVSITKEGESAITATLKELELNGYLSRKRIRNEQGHLGETEYTIQEKSSKKESEQPKIKKQKGKKFSEKAGIHKAEIADGESDIETKNTGSPDLDYPCMEKYPVGDKLPKYRGFDAVNVDAPNLDLPDLDFPDQDNPVLEKPNLENRKQYNTKELNTKSSRTNQSNHSINQIMEIDREKMDLVRGQIEKNIDYDIMVKQYGERLDDVVEIMLETMCSKQIEISFSESSYPIVFARDRLMSLNSMHIQYIFECLDNNATEIRNIKKYILKTLIDAPATMESYYTAKVKAF